MEGLEIQEFNLASILKHENIRLEAEFYTSQTELFSEYFLGKDIIKSCTYNSIYGMNAEGKGYPAIRMNEFDGLFTGKPTQFAHNFLLEDFKKHQLKENDILICRTNGNPNLVGKSALVMIDEPYVYESHLFKIQPKQEIINSHTLATYLNCKYGKQEIFRYSMQGNQSNFSLAKFKEMKIPKFSSALQKDIKILISSSFEKLQKSKEAYQAAQDLLLDHLGLKDFNLPAQAVNVKSFSDSFGRSGRLDAEFYQEKYEGYLKKIQAYPYGCEPIRTACKLKDANYTPKDNQTYRYIELSNIGNLGEITGASLDLGCNLPSRARRKVSKNDVVVSSIEGSLASCAIVSEQHHQALCSTGFYVVSSEKINSETLLILFKSEPIQQLLKQGCSGTILTAINKDEFLNIPLPLVDANIQTQIADLIRQSDRLRQESQALLEEAKRKVEQAIEG